MANRQLKETPTRNQPQIASITAFKWQNCSNPDKFSTMTKNTKFGETVPDRDSEVARELCGDRMETILKSEDL